MQVYLPDLHGHPLLNIVEEASEMNEKGKSFLNCFSSGDLKYHVHRRRLEQTSNLKKSKIRFNAWNRMNEMKYNHSFNHFQKWGKQTLASLFRKNILSPYIEY